MDETLPRSPFGGIAPGITSTSQVVRPASFWVRPPAQPKILLLVHADRHQLWDGPCGGLSAINVVAPVRVRGAPVRRAGVERPHPAVRPHAGGVSLPVDRPLSTVVPAFIGRATPSGHSQPPHHDIRPGETAEPGLGNRERIRDTGAATAWGEPRAEDYVPDIARRGVKLVPPGPVRSATNTRPFHSLEAGLDALQRIVHIGVIETGVGGGEGPRIDDDGRQAGEDDDADAKASGMWGKTSVRTPRRGALIEERRRVGPEPGQAP